MGAGGLQLDHQRCVRARAPAATCRACVDACPTSAVRLDAAGAVEVALGDCVGCGLCQAACPPDAFSGAVDVVRLLASAPVEVRCGAGGLPCVGALAAEDLLALALKRGRLEVVAAGCEAGPAGHLRARERVEEARRWAAALGLQVTLAWRDEAGAPPARPPPPRPPRPAPAPPVPERRRFLSLLVPGARAPPPVRLTRSPGLAVAEGSPAARRTRLLQALPPSVAPAVAEAALPGVASKLVDPALCTGCRACVEACPTGALSALRGSLRFEAGRCVACGLCELVCEPGALGTEATLRVGELLDFSPRVLVRLPPEPRSAR